MSHRPFGQCTKVIAAGDRWGATNASVSMTYEIFPVARVRLVLEFHPGFRGGAAVRSSADRYQPDHVDRGLEPARLGYHRIVADILRRAPAEDAARIAWQLVSGSQVAQRTAALGLQDGVLQVRVPDLTWRSQLSDFVPQYLVGLNSMLGNKVQRIEFVLAEKKAAHRA